MANRSCLQRVGYLATIVLVLGTAAIIGAVGLIYLIRRQSVQGDWATQAVTLSLVIIRWTVTAQASACTILLALVMLSRQVAVVLMINSTRTSPHQLTKGAQARSKFDLLFLVLVLFATTTICQFSTTTLLSDVRTSLVVEETKEIRYGFNGTRYMELWMSSLSESYWTCRSAGYPTFAEYSEPPIEADGVNDTGLTIRALLPLQSQSSRSLLRNFSGLSTAVDTRVTCIRPSAATIERPFIISRSMHSLALILQGIANASVMTPRLQQSRAKEPVPFKCTIPLMTKFDSIRAPKAALEWRTSVCLLDFEAGGLIPEFVNLSAPYSVRPRSYLVLNASGFYEDYWEIPYRDETPLLNQKPNGPWLDLLSGQTKISISLCYTAFNDTDFAVNVSSGSARMEPTLEWDINGESPSGVGGSWSSEGVRRQLGATRSRLPLEERGVMFLEKWKSWISDVRIGRGGQPMGEGNTTLFAVFASSREMVANTTSVFCTYCSAPTNALRVSRAHVALFQSILADTGNPALALQAHHTTVIQMAYYDRLAEFDVSSPATIVSFIPGLTPARYKGLGALTGALLVHLFCAFIIARLFISRVRLSALDIASQTLNTPLRDPSPSAK